ncbi:MAG: extracellular solute-binding protein [Alphaproteobacteria bacterium]|jgi:microcin C transport system substrate-binding protein|nr:extracellular solute-binding protein [Alphaproteobacteria bacterium]MDP6589897.1 extracellular solute-binding protein [Alphaproteobacteria bacterium]MDP6817451.1 extracellular solute-binding protein [Alphaproteobacteria bacterium]
MRRAQFLSFVVLFCAGFALAGAGLGPASAAEGAYSGHGVAMHGAPKYGPDFSHFDYVNADAPKGGDVRLSWTGSFDSLNPFILKGVSARYLGLTFETLMAGSSDEAFSQYGLIAGRVEFPADRSSVTFTLRQEARWHDGTPITVDDVIFSFEALTKKGAPFYRVYYANVAEVEDLGERRVKFSFAAGENRELPLILGQLAILSKKYFETHEFDKSTLEPILASGPYKVDIVDPGRAISYRRVADYWGAHLPVNRGRHNFDSIRIDYYRDDTVALEAFKAKEFDWRLESTAKVWAKSYSGPAIESGLIKKIEIAHENPTGMAAFVINTRRPLFADPRVREALGLAFDFEWTNKNLFFGTYTRTRSYFSNSELASSGLPGEAELKILRPYRGRIPEQVFTTEFALPVTDGSGKIRRSLRAATKLLRQAGWEVTGGKLVHGETGMPFKFEFLVQSGGAVERIVQAYARNLERLGIAIDVRLVDTTQYAERIKLFDFDMMWGGFGQSLSPGNEQRQFWSSAAADVPGSRNLIGIRDPVVDELIETIIAASDREALIAASRALDRVLLWGHYVVPLWHLRSNRIAYWDIFGRPEVTARYDHGFPSAWWIDPDRLQAMERGETSPSQ